MNDVDHTPAETALNGRYTRFRSVLGKGAYKTVYRGFDSDEALEIAWNKLHVERLQQHELEKVANEVKLLEQIHHKNIIRFFALLPSTERNGVKTIDFITELMTSGTLKDFLKRAKAIKLKVIRRWSFNILQAIQYLHSMEPPLMHRDLKCENIFINGHVGEVKIGDLGLSGFKVRDKADSVIGTPEFMAPELYESSYTEKVDLYAFGMCLLEMVTMEYPYSECTTFAQIFKKVYQGEKPRVLDRIIPGPFKNVIIACLKREAERPSAAQLLEDPLFRDWESDPGTEDNTSLLKGVSRGNGSGANPSGADIEWSDPLGRPIEVSYAQGKEVQRSQASASSQRPVRLEPEVVAMQANQQGGFKVGLTIPIEDRIKRVEFPFDPFKDTSEHLAQELVEVFELPQDMVPVIKQAIEEQMEIAREQREVAIRNTAPAPHPENSSNTRTDQTQVQNSSESLPVQSTVPEVESQARETIVTDSTSYHQSIPQVPEAKQVQDGNVALEQPITAEPKHASPDTISSSVREGSTSISGLPPVSIQSSFPQDLNPVPMPSVSGHSTSINSVPASPMPPAQSFAPEQSPPSTSPPHQTQIQATLSTPVVHPQTLTQHAPIQGTTQRAAQHQVLPQNPIPVYQQPQRSSPQSQPSNPAPVTHEPTTNQQAPTPVVQQQSHVTQAPVSSHSVQQSATHHVGSTPNISSVAAQPVVTSGAPTATAPSTSPPQVAASISQMPVAPVQSAPVDQSQYVPSQMSSSTHHSHQHTTTQQQSQPVGVPITHSNATLDQVPVSAPQQHAQAQHGSIPSQHIPLRQDTLSPIPETESQKIKSYAAAAASAPAQMQHNGSTVVSPPIQNQQRASDAREISSQLETSYRAAQPLDQSSTTQAHASMMSNPNVASTNVPVAVAVSSSMEQVQYNPPQPIVSHALPVSHVPSQQPQAPSVPVSHASSHQSQAPVATVSHVSSQQSQAPIVPVSHVASRQPQVSAAPVSHVSSQQPQQVPVAAVSHVPSQQPQQVPVVPVSHVSVQQAQVPVAPVLHVPSQEPQLPSSSLPHGPRQEPQLPTAPVSHVPHQQPQVPAAPIPNVSSHQPQVSAPVSHAISEQSQTSAPVSVVVSQQPQNNAVPVTLVPSQQSQSPAASVSHVPSQQQGAASHSVPVVTPNSISPPQQRVQQPPVSAGVGVHAIATSGPNPAPSLHHAQQTPVVSAAPQMRQEQLPVIPEAEPPPGSEQTYVQPSSIPVQPAALSQQSRPPMASPPTSVQSSVPENSEVGSHLDSDHGGANFGEGLPDSSYPPSVGSHQGGEAEAQFRESATKRPPAAPAHAPTSQAMKSGIIPHSASEQVLRAPPPAEALQHPQRSISAPSGAFSIDEPPHYGRVQPELTAASQAILEGLGQAGEPVVSARPLQQQSSAVNTSSDSRPGIVVVGSERRKSSASDKGNRRSGGNETFSAASLPEFTHTESIATSRVNASGNSALDTTNRQVLTGNNLRGNVNDAPSLAPPMSMGRRSSSWRSSNSESSFRDVRIRASPSDTILGSTYDQKWLASCLELMEHSTKGRYAAVAQKLDQGYPATFADYDRRTPLHLASSRGHLEIVSLLIERGASIKAADRWGRTALSDAVKNRHEHVAVFLRSNGAEEDMDVRSDAYGSIMLQSAARGDLEEVRRRLVAGANANFADYDKRTALHLACTEGHLDITELLLVNEANWNAMDNFGATPVDDAVRNGHKNILRLLRQYGAEIPKHLLGAHSDSEYQLGLDLVENAAKGRINAVKKCLRNGANPSFMDYDRRTALHLAAVEGHVAVVETLLRAGADVNAVDRWGGTPRTGAVNANMTAVVDELDNWAKRIASREAVAATGENAMHHITNGRSGRNMEKIRGPSQGSGKNIVSVMQHVFADGFVDRQASMSSMMQHVFADGFADRNVSNTPNPEVIAAVEAKKSVPVGNERGSPLRGVMATETSKIEQVGVPEVPRDSAGRNGIGNDSGGSGDVAREIVESVVEDSTTGAAQHASAVVE